MEENTSSHFENTSAQTLAPGVYDYFGFGDPQIYNPILNSLLCVSSSIGTAANCFVLLIIVRTKFGQKLSLQFLAHQAVCDLESSIAMLASTIAIWSEAAGPFICRMLWSQALLFTGLYASAFNTICLAAERYLMIVYPFRYRDYLTTKRAKIAMVTTWLVSIALNTPVVTAIYSDNGQCYMDYFLKSATAQQIYSYILVVATFLIPITFICFAYGRMLWVIHRKPQKQIQPGPSSSQPTNNSTKMSKVQMNIFQTLVIITAVFAVTWIPNQLYYLLYSVGVPLDFYDPLYILSMVLVQVNACVNPIIYLYKFEGFHEHALALLKCRPRNQVAVVPDQTLANASRSRRTKEILVVPSTSTTRGHFSVAGHK